MLIDVSEFFENPTRINPFSVVSTQTVGWNGSRFAVFLFNNQIISKAYSTKEETVIAMEEFCKKLEE